MREKTPMMKCGHAANAKNGKGEPVCVICSGLDPGAEIIADEPGLTGRTARCAYNCGNEQPSSPNLAFFEYRGVGSHRANTICKNCGYGIKAHTPEARAKNKRLTCQKFEPHGPYQYDQYYCGCKGWD